MPSSLNRYKPISSPNRKILTLKGNEREGVGTLFQWGFDGLVGKY
jgi:hypothetical protein